MDVRAAATTPSTPDTRIALLTEGAPPPDGALAPLLESGEARTREGALALARDGDGRRVLGVGAGAADELDAERVRRALAVAFERACELGARELAVLGVPAEHAGAAVEGLVLASYRYEAPRPAAGGGRTMDAPQSATEAGRTTDTSLPATDDEALQRRPRVAHIVGADPEDVARAALVARAVNAARTLQDAPPNLATPALLAQRARELADAHATLHCELLDRAAIEAAGYGALAGVAAGSAEEPALICLRHAPQDATGGAPPLGLVGKGVTFDSGGYSLKPAASMTGQKYDLSGGVAVLEAIGAIAALGPPLPVVAVVGATPNLVAGGAMRPGDVLTAGDGTTIEVTNTDAEGRLVLADCLLHARARGARRLVTLATLTGGARAALSGVHAALIATDDDWAAQVERAGARSDELVWRLPMHPAYERMLESRVADAINANLDRRAQPITAAHFLARFAGELPFAHIDMAGMGADRDLPYARKGGSGFGVRLLVELARALAR